MTSAGAAPSVSVGDPVNLPPSIIKQDQIVQKLTWVLSSFRSLAFHLHSPRAAAHGHAPPYSSHRHPRPCLPAPRVAALCRASPLPHATVPWRAISLHRPIIGPARLA